jgi:hypothetical protein
MSRARTLACLLLALVPAAVCGSAESPAADSDIITLPPFEVRALRPWLSYRIPGFEVLSLASEARSREVLERFVRAARFVPLFLPENPNAPGTVPVTLFINHFEGDRTIAELEKELPPFLKVGALHITANGSLIQLPGTEVTTAIRMGSYSAVVLIVNGVANLSRPGLPYWYRDGINRMLRGARVSDSALEVPRQDWSEGAAMPLGELLGVVDEGASLTYTRGAAGAEAAGAVWGMDAAQIRRLAVTMEELKERYLATASLFLHWGLVGDDGGRRAQFLAFLSASGTRAPGESLFREHFGIGFDEAARVIQEYAARTRGREERLALPSGESRPAETEISGGPATLEDVSRLVGEFYVALGGAGIPIEARNRDQFALFPEFSTEPAQRRIAEQRGRYRALARSVLVDGLRAPRRHPDVLAQLGILEFDEGRKTQAREILEEAIAGGASRPFAHALLATLRMNAAGVFLGDDAPIGEAQAAIIREPLDMAWALRPRLPDAYRILAELVRRADAAPTSRDLELLRDAVREFPAEVTLQTAIASTLDRIGRRTEARAIVDSLILLPGVRPSDIAEARRMRGEWTTPVVGQ